MNIKLYVGFCLICFLLFTGNAGAEENFLDKPQRLAVESLGQIEDNNSHFKIILQPEFKSNAIEHTGNGQYILARKQGFWQMIDADGKMLIKPGKLKVIQLGGSKYDPKFNTPEFSPGETGVVQVVENDQKKYIFIDIHGNQVIKQSFAWASPFKNGIARVRDTDKNYWFIGPKGNSLTPKYKKLYRMKNDRAFFSYYGRLWGMLDNHFKVVVEPKYKKTGGFTDDSNLTYVQMSNDLYGFIDKAGNMVIPAKYTRAGYFRSGIAQVSLEPKGNNRSFFFIDKNANPLFNNLKVYNQTGFHGEIATVKMRIKVETCPGKTKMDFRYGAINTKGETVHPFIFKSLDTIWPDSLFIKGVYPQYKIESGKCEPALSLSLGVGRDGKLYKDKYTKLPARVAADAPFYKKLAYLFGTKVNGKTRRGLSYYFNDEKESVFITPQFEKLTHLKGPLYKFRVGKKAGVIKVIE